MVAGMNRSQEIELLNFLAEITLKEDLQDLITYIVDNASRIFRVGRCSIYLRPEFVLQHSGELISDLDQPPIPAQSLDEDYIVMAGTNYEVKKEFVGRMYYTANMDLTGWVFKTGRTLRLKDASDLDELKSIDPNLDASRRYKSLEPEHGTEEKFPILYIPLKIDGITIGVLKLHRPIHHQLFDEEAETVGTITAQILGNLIEKIQIASGQSRTIRLLAEFGTEKTPQEVYQHITRTIPEMLDCSRAQLYLRDPHEESVYLAYQNGKPFARDRTLVYRSREGFMGWIFKTGHSLNIEDMWHYWDPVILTDELLSHISDSIDVDDEDRRLEVLAANKSYIGEVGGTQPFIGVPIFDSDGSVLGVLCAHSVANTREKMQRRGRFTEAHLQHLKTFANFISLATQSERTRNKGELLLQMSRSADVQELFKLVSAGLPELIHDTDCLIFRLERSEPHCLQLVASNRQVVPLAYAVGEGKTGFSALAESTTIIDHFGRGKRNAVRIDERRKVLQEQRPHDLLGDLSNEDGERVGIICLENGRGCPEQTRLGFEELCRTQVIKKGVGLPSRYMASYAEMQSRPSYSFISVPIMIEEHQLEGVIAIARSMRRNPFSSEEIEFVQAISKTLGQVLGVLELQNQRETLYVTLAHEITTYLTAIRADAENLQAELGSSHGLHKLASHLSGQVERLSLMSENILCVAAGKRSGVKITNHSIYRPLMDAISMFREEAAILRCDILDPKSSDGGGFPNIEMRLFELTLAFKNLIHNAIKYSFYPPRGLEKHRFVRVTGSWADRAHQHYRVSIENFGAGITEKEREHGLIFKPFYRGLLSQDRERPGSGIGLSYVYQVVVTMHHGRVEVESVPKGGQAFLTTFHVILPLRQPRAG